jgi:hypothetical protein
MFKRKPKRSFVNEWPPGELIDHAVYCVSSNPEELEVRSALVLHQNLARLPENIEDLAMREAQEQGIAFDGFCEYVTYMFGFEHDDRVGLYMDYDRSCLVKGVVPIRTLEDAKREADRWVGDGSIITPFSSLPGVYQLSFVEYITGIEQESHPSEFCWAIDSDESTPMVITRRFPPAANPTEDDPNPDEVLFSLLPRHAVQEIFSGRGW